MTITPDDSAGLTVLESRIRALLPDEYEDCYDEVQPTSMGSAGLKFDRDGKVAWDQMWASFCDLAMAGGPPHKGTLLEPATPSEIEAQPERYRAVIDEIARGVTMVTDLQVHLTSTAGWVRVTCFSEGMAGWLLRAIVMENVAARANGSALFIPAAPDFRVEKEIKNVVTVMAKTCHYWLGHVSLARRRAIGALFATMAVETPLVEPVASSDGPLLNGDQMLFARMSEAIQQETGLQVSRHRYTGWIGVECPSVRVAIWMMRTMVVSNILSRREGTVLFVPVNPDQDPTGDRVVSALTRTLRFATLKGVR